MGAFIDIHHHFLYGVDDGAETKLEMQNMLVAAWKDGIRTIIATPHVVPGVTPFSVELFRSQIEEAKLFCTSFGQEMGIHLGAEVLYNYQAHRYLSEQRIPTLAESGKILLEFSSSVTVSEIEEAISVVLRSGCLPVLAHVERYPCLILDKQKLRSFKREYDVYYQVNADQVLNGSDYRTNKAVTRAIQEELIDFVATDAHNLRQRKCSMQAAYDKLAIRFGRKTADRLTGNGKTRDWFQNL